MRPLLLLFLTAALPAQSLLDEARSQPIEIFADVAFALIPRLPPDLKIATLTEIFDRAGEARALYPTTYPDVKALDALSLRTRAIRTLLPIDATRGRRLFEAMQPPNVPPTPCTQAVAPNAGVYMDTVAAVVGQGHFTDEEKKKGVPLAIAIHAVRGASSGAEIAAAHPLAWYARSSEADETAMAAAFTSALSLQESDRSFTSIPPDRLVSSMTNLRTFLPRTSQVALLTAMRAYLVRQLTAERCEVSGRAADGVRTFADAVARYPDIPPLSPTETEPAKRAGKPAVPAVDPGYATLQGQMQAIATATRAEEAAKERTTLAWMERARQVLMDVAAWKGGSGRDPVDLAADKLKLLKQMVDIAPDGAIRQAALGACLEVLGDPALLLRSPLGWVAEVRYFMSLADNTGRALPDLFLASRSPALRLYGQLMLLQRSTP